jgi:hypothetical protein
MAITLYDGIAALRPRCQNLQSAKLPRPARVVKENNIKVSLLFSTRRYFSLDTISSRGIPVQLPLQVGFCFKIRWSLVSLGSGWNGRDRE